MNRLRNTCGLIAVVLALALAGCATTESRAPAAPIANVAAIAGTWRGTLNVGAGDTPCTLTIAPTGAATLVGSTRTFNGTVTAQGGKGSFSFDGQFEGSVVLYEGGGKRELNLDGRSGQFQAWVTKQ